MIARAPFVRVLLVMSLVSLVSASALGVSSGAGDSWAVRVPDVPTARQRDKFGYGLFDFQTTFCEARLGSYSPINTQTSIGLPGTVPIAFSNLMRLRYSEFEINFTMLTEKGENPPFLMPNFKQTVPRDWLPGCVSEWDEDGIHYKVSLIMVPSDPQPVDLVQIALRNIGTRETRGKLMVTLDGAPTLRADSNLIEDRGKPLVIMDPLVPVDRLARDAGCVDPRAKAAAPWNAGLVKDWPNRTWKCMRVGFYGMPIEYMLRVRHGESLQVFLGFQSVNEELCREVQATVEGDANSQKTKTPAAVSYDEVYHDRSVLGFVGRDTDDDGYIKISVQATPEYPQRTILNVIQAYSLDARVTPEDVRKEQNLPEPRYMINVGADAPTAANLRTVGRDPTVNALRLAYTPNLAPGEERVYLLRLPAIDRPEPGPHTGFTPRPYDTGESWMNPFLPRHPENKVPYGLDVPTGTDLAKYAAFGPKPRDVWDRQLAAVKAMTWEDGMTRLGAYWDSFLARGAQFVTPEPVVSNLYKKQVAMLATHRIKFSNHDHYVSVDGPDFYWEYTPRGGAYEYVAMDWAGYPDVARASWKTVLTPRSKLPAGNRWGVGQFDDADPMLNGMWLTRPLQHDAQGQTLWGLTEHYLLTGDKKWLAKNYDAIKRGGDWIIRVIDAECKRIGDPNHAAYGLMPMAGDEPPIGSGHSIYVNALALEGLHRCVMAAGEIRKTEDASRFDKAANGLQNAFDRAIEKSFIRFSDFVGSIPENVEVGLQSRDGKPAAFRTDFCGSLLYPTGAMAPQDPFMTALYRYREKEASFTGGIMLWPYIYAEDGVGYICRGDYDKSADLFYAYIASAYHTLDWGEEQYLLGGRALGYAYSNELVQRWQGAKILDVQRKQIVGYGESPHTWASAFYIEWLRMMMLREDGDALHIAPAIPRKWLAQLKPVGVERAPSYFGLVTYHLQADPDQTTIRGDVQLDAKRKPARLIIHIRAPGGRGLESVKINGKNRGTFSGDEIVVPNPPGKIELEVTYRR